MDKEFRHYGMPRRSGRYPYGTGENPIQRYATFLKRVHELEKQGFTSTEIAKDMGMKSPTLRAKTSIAKDEIKKSENVVMLRLQDKGWSNGAIAKRFGFPNESTVRSRLDPISMERTKKTTNIVNVLKEHLGDGKSEWIDIGPGIPARLGIAPTKLLTAVAMLKEEGYQIRTVPQLQPGTGKYTTQKVLLPPGASYHDLMDRRPKIGIVLDKSPDGGYTFDPPVPPRSIDSSRVKVIFAGEAGTEKDGVIELRKGVPELDLGRARYAQVRIAVDGTHFLKGMAVYSDKMPEGIDIVYNTNKKAEDGVEKAMKDLKPTNPLNQFGSSIKKSEDLSLIETHYTDENGVKQLSALNIVHEEGDWSTWAKTISSQVLSKQTPALAKQQLQENFDMKREEFEEIMSLTQPSVKKKLLDSFANDCDSSSVHLKGASLPRQQSQVLLPIVDVKETEIFAPNFLNGERVVLIRYPHGGLFEIPELTVNNKSPMANKLMPNALDAVGVNPIVKQQLSGADFDGDTVLVIPNNSGIIEHKPALTALMDYDHIAIYKLPAGTPKISGTTKQQEMGKISNLITDMTIKGAPPEEICKAVRHSMVVIDSQKHDLNYKQSYIDNGIAALKLRYQGKVNAGAATIISKAASAIYVNEQKQGKWIYNKELGTKKKLYVDPVTGKKLYEATGEAYPKKTIKPPDQVDPVTGEVRKLKERPVFTDKKTKQKYYKVDGKPYYIDDESAIKEKMVNRKTKLTKMANTDDAYTLTSDKIGGEVMERLYADHANKLKALANTARKEAIATQEWPVVPSAKETYAKERKSLLSQVAIAVANKPYERRALALAKGFIDILRADNPSMDEEDFKKRKDRALIEARDRAGAKKVPVVISDSEWEAIQSGAINKNLIKDVLDNTDMKAVKQRAMPRTTKGMSSAKVARARSMLSKGTPQSDVAQQLGVSVSTLMLAVK